MLEMLPVGGSFIQKGLNFRFEAGGVRPVFGNYACHYGQVVIFFRLHCNHSLGNQPCQAAPDGDGALDGGGFKRRQGDPAAPVVDGIFQQASQLCQECIWLFVGIGNRKQIDLSWSDNFHCAVQFNQGWGNSPDCESFSRCEFKAVAPADLLFFLPFGPDQDWRLVPAGWIEFEKARWCFDNQ